METTRYLPDCFFGLSINRVGRCGGTHRLSSSFWNIYLIDILTWEAFQFSYLFSSGFFFYHWFGSRGTLLKCYLIYLLYFCLTCSILCCVLCIKVHDFYGFVHKNVSAKAVYLCTPLLSAAFQFKSLLSTFLVLNTHKTVLWWVRDVCPFSMGPFHSRSVPMSEESDLWSIFSSRWSSTPASAALATLLCK